MATSWKRSIPPRQKRSPEKWQQLVSVTALEQTYDDAVAHITAPCAQLATAQRQLDWFRRQLFGSTSERQLEVDPAVQQSLFAGLIDGAPSPETQTFEITRRQKARDVRYAQARPDVIHAQCWADTRRGFERALDSEPQAQHGLALIRALYRQEALIRDKRLDGPAKQTARSAHCQPAVRAFAALERGLDFHDVDEFQTESGRGVVATVNGEQIRIGSPTFLVSGHVDLNARQNSIESSEQQGHTVIVVSD